jgi:hypothetical protein
MACTAAVTSSADKQVAYQDSHFGLFLVGQVLTGGLLKRGDRVFALLDEFVHDGHHGDIVQFDPLVHFFLLQGRQQQADGAQALSVFGAHGVFHVFGDLFFQAHERLLQRGFNKKGNQEKTKPA